MRSFEWSGYVAMPAVTRERPALLPLLLAESAHELLGCGGRRVGARAREHDGELVTAEPVRLADPAQLARDVSEHAVADRMAVAVVDLLEVVEVEEADGQRLARGRGLLELDLELLLEVTVVAETGQRVGQREPHGAQRVVRRALVQRDGDERADEDERERRRLRPEDDEREADGEHDRERRSGRERRRAEERQERLAATSARGPRRSAGRRRRRRRSRRRAPRRGAAPRGRPESNGVIATPAATAASAKTAPL